MYSVVIYNRDEVYPSDFVDKNAAIRYFNHCCDRLFIQSLKADRIEILHDSTVLFDYEV